ncbi:MAG TPA: recombinase family protein [Syntrophales bacterium]|nr:recombinase family protein [Syntrophales bacterium]
MTSDNGKKQNGGALREAKTVAYVRVSTDAQDTDNQKHEIEEYALRHALTIAEYIEVTMSSKKSIKERKIDELLDKLTPGDTLIVSELSRLGRSIPEVISLVNGLVAHNIRLICIKQNIDIRGYHDTTSKVMVTIFSLLAELERDLLSQRTKSALAALKADGKKLGRPVGSKGKSKFEDRQAEIVMFLEKKVPVAAIARILGCSRLGLLNFLKSRNLYTEKRKKEPKA